MKIEKYTFSTNEIGEIGHEESFSMPPDAVVVSVGISGRGVAIYAMGTPSEQTVERKFLLTGSRRELPSNFNFIGTVSIGLTWHVGELVSVN